MRLTRNATRVRTRIARRKPSHSQNQQQIDRFDRVDRFDSSCVRFVGPFEPAHVYANIQIQRHHSTSEARQHRFSVELHHFCFFSPPTTHQSVLLRAAVTAEAKVVEVVLRKAPTNGSRAFLL